MLQHKKFVILLRLFKKMEKKKFVTTFGKKEEKKGQKGGVM